MLVALKLENGQWHPLCFDMKDVIFRNQQDLVYYLLIKFDTFTCMCMHACMQDDQLDLLSSYNV